MKTFAELSRQDLESWRTFVCNAIERGADDTPYLDEVEAGKIPRRWDHPEAIAAQCYATEYLELVWNFVSWLDTIRQIDNAIWFIRTRDNN